MRKNGFVTGLMYVLLVFLAVGLALLVFFNFQANSQQMAEIAAAEEAAATTPTPPPTATPAPTATPTRTTETVTLGFAGDLVGQSGLSTDAKTTTENDDGDEVTAYDYTSELAGVKTTLSDVDFAACTLVSTLTEEDETDAYRLSGSMAQALAGAGFKLVNVATDHILDSGLDGLTTTVDLLRDEGLAVAGAYTGELSRGLYIANVDGVQVAFLSYTYGTGGVSVVENPWCVDILTTDYMTGQETIDYDKIESDIAAVKNAGADVVACFVYWWDNTQYYNEPRSAQTELAEYLFENGVDILIGGGVKSPQPIRVETVERADGTKANCVALYSLSNLMSCFNDVYTNLTATAKIELSRDVDTGEVWVSGVSYAPLFMLDTDDYSDYSDPGYKYRLLDAYATMEDFEQGDSEISQETYDAIVTGVLDLQTILGEEYDTINGGVSLDFPY
jgi:poly-gamma-glutamate synthesis protein (capsule biosynthesis protein)